MIEFLEYLTHQPATAVWELTLACNMRCQHCGSFAGAPRERELSWEEAQVLAEDLVGLGLQHITLSGGEPTLCPYWAELGGFFRARGVLVNIISNGWTWSESHLSKAKAHGFNSVAFSLDGFEETHDRIRRKGSFARVVAALDLCRAHGMPTGVISHVNRLNLPTLRELRTFLGEHGVGLWQLQLGNPQGVMCEHTELVIAPEELLSLIPLVAELRGEPGEPRVDIGDNIGYYGKYEDALRRTQDLDPELPAFWFGCCAGVRVVGIESNGNIKGCLSLPSAMHGLDKFVEGNVRERRLPVIWNDPDAFAYNRKQDPARFAGFCASCPHREVCRGGCSWTTHSHSGFVRDNPYCFYRQAVLAGRTDLLGDEGALASDIQAMRTALRELVEERGREGA